MNEISYLENFGTGIPRMLKANGSSKKKPEFRPTENFFTLSLPIGLRKCAIVEQWKFELC